MTPYFCSSSRRGTDGIASYVKGFHNAEEGQKDQLRWYEAIWKLPKVPYTITKMPTTTNNLAGLNVLITRPAAQASAFAEMVQQAHGRPVCFPTLEMLGPPDKAAVQQALAGLATVDLLIFTSTNAVHYAFPLLPADIPLNLPLAAIGAATAGALTEIGLPPTLTPDSPDTEGLLALPDLHCVQGSHILIVRGHGGRETLKQTLEKRGARVDNVEVYRRHCPNRNPHNLIQSWAQWVDVVTITSNEILDNLQQMLGAAGQPLVQQTPLIVPSRRVAEYARQLGCQQIHQAQSALDKDMLHAVQRFHTTLPV